MNASTRTFRRSLYHEHLDEGAFLVEQRYALRAMTQTQWSSFADLEDRLEAHIDALVVGGKLASQVCQEREPAGDAGEPYVVLAVYCRTLQSESLDRALRDLALHNPFRRAAVVHSLCDELPAQWSSVVERAVTDAPAENFGAVVEACGLRRIGADPVLDRLGRLSAQEPLAPPLIRALGRLGDVRARPMLERRLQCGDESGRREALLALARLGVAPRFAGADSEASLRSWPHLVYGMSADRNAGSFVMNQINSRRVDASSLLTLGLLGDTTHVPTLIELLSAPKLAAHAATALHWLLGAELYQDGFAPDQVDEEELFDDELAVWTEREEAPRRVDGTPFGEKTHALSTDGAVWREWWKANSRRLPAGLCIRKGRPHGPMALQQDLADPRSDRRLRAFTAEELFIRYGCPVPFEIDMPVRRQQRALREIVDWIQSRGQRYMPGGWYFAGSPM